MSEELDTTQEVKDLEENKSHDKKKSSKKRELEIIEQFQYNPVDGEKLIMDKPSEPLESAIKKDLPKKIMTQKPKVELKSNKELYESYIKELKYFSLNLNDEVIYDSSIDKSKDSPVKFDNDYFILYGKKYSYNGLKIQKINKK